MQELCRRAWCGLGLLACLGSAAAAQDEQTWQVTKTPERCTLQRRVTAPTPAALMLTTYPGSDDYSLTVAAATMPRHAAGSFPVTVILHDSGKRIVREAMAGRLRGALPEAFEIRGLGAAELRDLAASKALSVSAVGRIGPLALPDLAEAIAAFEGCTGEHLAAMGADPRQFAPGGTKPVPIASRENWISRSETNAIMDRVSRSDAAKSGGVANAAEDYRYKVTIDATGRIDGCGRTDGKSAGPLDPAVCAAVVGKPLFQAARDPAGNAVRGAATFYGLYIARRAYSP